MHLSSTYLAESHEIHLQGLECCRLQDIRCFDAADMDAFIGSLTSLKSLEIARSSRQSVMPTCRSLSSLQQLQVPTFDCTTTALLNTEQTSCQIVILRGRLLTLRWCRN